MVTHCKRLRPLVPLAWMGVIWVLSSIPATPDHTMAGVFIPKMIQKTMHVVFYAILCGLWLWVMDLGRPTRVGAVSAVGLTTLYAAVDEIHQTFTPGRFGSAADVALDAAAAVLAAVLIGALTRSPSPRTG
jgi:VanZ family protein